MCMSRPKAPPPPPPPAPPPPPPPPPPEPPPAPKPVSPRVQQARSDETRRVRAQTGAKSLTKTSSRGTTGEANTNKKKLIGQ